MRKIIICNNCKKEKIHYGNKLCSSCYHKQYKKPVKVCAKCEELKIHAGKELCVSCYIKQNLIICEECGKEKPHYSKKLCITCYKHKTGISQPMNLNKSCPSYLGVHIAEQLLSKIFKDVEKMPYAHKGYDFICNKGMKIDVKSGILKFIKSKPNYKGSWNFTIRKNQTPDYFLCIAFDNREDKIPQHLWLIPAEKVNHLQTASISKSKLNKWAQYEQPLDKTIECCNELKQI